MIAHIPEERTTAGDFAVVLVTIVGAGWLLYSCGEERGFERRVDPLSVPCDAPREGETLVDKRIDTRTGEVLCRYNAPRGATINRKGKR